MEFVASQWLLVFAQVHDGGARAHVDDRKTAHGLLGRGGIDRLQELRERRPGWSALDVEALDADVPQLHAVTKQVGLHVDIGRRDARQFACRVARIGDLKAADLQATGFEIDARIGDLGRRRESLFQLSTHEFGRYIRVL